MMQILTLVMSLARLPFIGPLFLDVKIQSLYSATAGDIARRHGYIELGNIIDSSTSTTVSLATSPAAATPAPNGATKHEAAAPRPIPLLPLMHHNRELEH